MPPTSVHKCNNVTRKSVLKKENATRYGLTPDRTCEAREAPLMHRGYHRQGLGGGNPLLKTNDSQLNTNPCHLCSSPLMLALDQLQRASIYETEPMDDVD